MVHVKSSRPHRKTQQAFALAVTANPLWEEAGGPGESPRRHWENMIQAQVLVIHLYVVAINSTLNFVIIKDFKGAH